MARFDNEMYRTNTVIYMVATDTDLPTRIYRTNWMLRGLSFTASGYGKRIPTAYMVMYNKRWHRVYCRIYSNIGTCYIEVNRQPLIVDNR